MTPTEFFFLKELPTLVVRELPRFRALRGSLAFSCAGVKFTVSLGDLREPVIHGFLRSADVKLWFFGDAFERFLEGVEVSGKEHVMIKGDLTVLERFGHLLQPTRSSLSVQFASVTT